jgi:two-component system chemotaxis response regulator CheB
LIPQLPVDDVTGYLLIQHMPPGFTKSLSERLNRNSELLIQEAADGDKLEPGMALMAPGGRHMTITRGGIIRLNDGPTVHGVRPAADVTMKSVADLFGDRTVAAVLTGMGVDARDGVRAIKAAGGYCVVEHESTCSVYGMPKAIADAGLADAIAPLGEVATKIIELISKRTANAVGAKR